MIMMLLLMLTTMNVDDDDDDQEEEEVAAVRTGPYLRTTNPIEGLVLKRFLDRHGSLLLVFNKMYNTMRTRYTRFLVGGMLGHEDEEARVPTYLIDSDSEYYLDEAIRWRRDLKSAPDRQEC